MGTLIRSAQIANDPRVLPLGNAHHQSAIVAAPAPAPISSTIIEPAPAVITTMTSIEPLDFNSDPNFYEVDTLAPAELDPLLKQSLLAEMQGARDAAIQEGFEAGHAQGMVEANQSLQGKIDALNNLLGSATETLQSQIIGLEDVVVALAFETVCKIIGSAMHDREGVVAVVREVIEHVKESEPITIRVSPADYHHLATDQAALTQTYFASGITLIPDDRVVLGGCLIETSGGSLDGRLETQLQQVRDALLSARRQRADWKETSHAV